MKGPILAILSLILITCSVKKEQSLFTPTCLSVREGKFYTNTENAGRVSVTIVGDKYLEQAMGKMTTCSIEWTSDCTYVLRHLLGDVPPGPHGMKNVLGEIIEVTKEYHVVRERIEGTDIENDYKMIRRN